MREEHLQELLGKHRGHLGQVGSRDSRELHQDIQELVGNQGKRDKDSILDNKDMRLEHRELLERQDTLQERLGLLVHLGNLLELLVQGLLEEILLLVEVLVQEQNPALVEHHLLLVLWEEEAEEEQQALVLLLLEVWQDLWEVEVVLDIRFDGKFYLQLCL